MGSPFIIPNNFFFFLPRVLARKHPQVAPPSQAQSAEGRPENKHFDGGRAEFPTHLNTVRHESPKDIRMLFSSK